MIIDNQNIFVAGAVISDHKILEYLNETRITYPTLKQRQAIDAKREWMRSMSLWSTRSGKSIHIDALIDRLIQAQDLIDLTV
jgi:hypothetical protein